MPIIRLLQPGEVPLSFLTTTQVPLPPQPIGSIGSSDHSARADHVHPEQELNIEEILSVTNPQPIGTASPGMSLKAAREDHVHPGEDLVLSDDIPSSPGTASAGTSDEPSRSDHVHAAQIIPPVPTVNEETVAATAKTTPVAADLFPMVDSENSNSLKKLTIDNLRIFLTPYFNTRPILTTHKTIYVRTDGNNSNDGSANTSAKAFLTIQAGMNAALSYDLNGFNITIQVGAGTYTTGVSMSQTQVGSGYIILSGDVTTPSNVIINTSAGHNITVENGARLNVQGFRLINTANSLVLASYQSVVTITGKMEFGATTGHQLYSVYSGVLSVGANYSIVGSGASHWAADRGGVLVSQSRTLTLTGTPSFSTGFAYSDINGSILCNGNTFSGSATGARYYVQTGGVIQTYGGGATALPGNAAGGVGAGGIYG